MRWCGLGLSVLIRKSLPIPPKKINKQKKNCQKGKPTPTTFLRCCLVVAQTLVGNNRYTKKRVYAAINYEETKPYYYSFFKQKKTKKYGRL